MRWLRPAPVLVSLLAAGCPSSNPAPGKAAPPVAAAPKPPPPPEPTAGDGGAVAAAPPSPPIVPPKPVAKMPKPGTRELAGLKLEIKKDGTARLTGKDRWGQKIDTTYESAAYLREAIPVLKRSATDAQSTALDKLATELAPAK